MYRSDLRSSLTIIELSYRIVIAIILIYRIIYRSQTALEMLQKSVPDPYSGDWRSSVAVGWESGTGNRQFMRWSETQMPPKLRLCWMAKFISEVWWCQATNTFIYHDGQHEIHKVSDFIAPYSHNGWLPEMCRSQNFESVSHLHLPFCIRDYVRIWQEF